MGSDPAQCLRSVLTSRELDVLRLLMSGGSNQDIAVELGISVTTVRTHVQRILRKLDVPNRTGAAILAHGLGLYPPSGGVR